MKNKQKHIVKVVADSVIHNRPIWRFDKLDMEGRFAFQLSRSDFKHKEVLQKLIHYGNMTWGEIDRQQHDSHGKSKHHYLDVRSLSDAAKMRISAKHLDNEIDALFSFALQNKLRIIGFRYGAEFYLVWYDPNHEFCPSSRH